MVKGAHLNPINLAAQPLDGISSSAAASKRKGTELNVSNLDATTVVGSASPTPLPFHSHNDDLDLARQHEMATSMQLSAALQLEREKDDAADAARRKASSKRALKAPTSADEFQRDW
jgi:hypothetical protein